MSKPIINKLKNGFVVGFVPHHGVKSVTIQLRGFAGSNFEKKNQIGSAHLVEHFSVENSNKDRVMEAGGKIVGVTSRDDVLYMVKVLKKDFALGVDYLFSVMNSRNFNKESLETQKKIAQEEIKRFVNIPEKLINRLSFRMLYPKDRMANYNTGDLEDIKKLSIENLIEFKKKNYKAGNFCIVVAGDLTPKQVLSKCTSKFGILARSERKYPRLPKRDKQLRVLNIHNRYFTQTHIKIDYYGFLLTESGKFALSVLAKLFDNYLKIKVRAQKGYAYNVGCEIFSSYSYGTFSIYVALAKENVNKVLEIISYVFKNPEAIINDRNISIAKNQIISDLEFSFDKTSFKAEYYSQLILQNFLRQTFDYETVSIEKVTEKSIYKVFDEVAKQKPKITVLSDSDILKLVKKYAPVL